MGCGTSTAGSDAAERAAVYGQLRRTQQPNHTSRGYPGATADGYPAATAGYPGAIAASRAARGRSHRRTADRNTAPSRGRSHRDAMEITRVNDSRPGVGHPPTKIKNNFNIVKDSLRLIGVGTSQTQLQFSYDATRAGEGEIFWGCIDSTSPTADPEEIANHGLDISRVDGSDPDIFKFKKGAGQVYTGYCEVDNIGSWTDDDVFDLVVRLRGVVDDQEQSQTTFCRLNREGTKIEAFLQNLTYQGYIVRQFEAVYGQSRNGGQSSESDANMCVVCYTEPRDCIILPCRHVCLCYACARDLNERGSVELRYGEVETGADPKCPMCRTVIEEVIHDDSLAGGSKGHCKQRNSKPAGTSAAPVVGKKTSRSIQNPAEPSSDHGLPYGGNLQAAMKAQDRPAIRRLMEAREKSAATASSSVLENASRDQQQLPYGGDLQAAMKARSDDFDDTILYRCSTRSPSNSYPDERA